MGYVVAGTVASGPLGELVGELRTSLERAGFEPAVEGVTPALVLNVVDVQRPRPFRRGSRGTFVAALHVLDAPPPDPLREGYPMLVRALANVSLTVVPGHGVWFTTHERGSYLVPADDGAASLADAVVERLAPLARSRLVIDNDFRTDLEPELWDGDAITAWAGSGSAASSAATLSASSSVPQGKLTSVAGIPSSHAWTWRIASTSGCSW